MQVIKPAIRCARIMILPLIASMFLFGPPAAAESWNYASQSAPLSVSGYGSWATTYGTMSTIRTGVNAAQVKMTSAYYKYYDADDHTVYIAMGYSADAPLGDAGIVESSHDNVYPSSSWTMFLARPSIIAHGAPGASQLYEVDGTVSSCIDVPWKFDPCAGVARTFSNF